MTLQRFNPYPIQWYEGMFLVPQHFQQADLRQQNILSYHLANMSPYYWGVLSMAIDGAQLVNGILNVLSLEAILPDGTPIFFPDSPTETLSLNLTELPGIKENEPFKICICVPENVAENFEQSDNASRYISVESPLIKDANTGDSPLRIARLKPRVALVAGNGPARASYFPLIEVVRQGSKFSQTNFLPPQLSVPLDSTLGLNCLGLTKRIRDKLVYLQSKIHNHLSDSTLGLEKANANLEALRQQLVVGLLSFEAVLNTNMSHPYELFKALSTLAAHGFALKRGEYPPAFSPYKHDDPNASFNQLLMFLDDVLNNIEEAYVGVPLVQKERVYSIMLQPEWGNNNLIFGAHAQPGSTEDDMVRWIQEAVIASDSFIDMVQENRVLGAEREIVNSVPQLNLVPFRGMVLFSVTNDRRFISSHESLRIFNISDNHSNRPQQITLYLPNT